MICTECGGRVYEGESPGVFLHEDDDLDADHMTTPDDGLARGLLMWLEGR